MAAPLMPVEFDPLIDLDGVWTTQLADDYLPDPRFPAAKYECINGRLIVSPTEVGTNSWGEIKLARLIAPAAEAAGFYVYGAVNLTFHPGKWIQPDVTLLHSLPRTDEEDKWIPVGLCTMAVEFVSPAGSPARRSAASRAIKRPESGGAGSRKQDYVDKPQRCAEGGVPYFMRVEIARRTRHASVRLMKLVDGRYRSLASAEAGLRFEAKEPFAISFDPVELLP